MRRCHHCNGIYDREIDRIIEINNGKNIKREHEIMVICEECGNIKYGTSCEVKE